MAEIRFLISIGINDYEIKPLDYCVKDSEDIITLMQNYCKVNKKNHYHVFSDENEPNVNIYDSFVRSFNKIKARFIENEDSIFFYFSGHGVPSGKSTALLFHERKIELQELFYMFSSLKPKFIFCLIDSCFSGVGIESEVGKSTSDYLFAQEVKLADGYNIICACSSDSTAKEDENLENGRMTRLFIDVVQNKIHYKYDMLSLNKVFQLIDDEFKNNPEFKQFPFSQTKGLSTYPLALLSKENVDLSYSTHYIDDVELHDWSEFKQDLSIYCSLEIPLVNECTRLIRELLRNSKRWSDATFTKVEICKGSVSIYDNSGTYFDIFNPDKEITLRGGGTTAKLFREKFADRYEYSYSIKENETIQIFTFTSISCENECIWKVENLRQLRDFQNNLTITIPDICSDYEIYIPQGGIDYSSIYAFLRKAIITSQSTNKPIKIIIEDNDMLKDTFIDILANYLELGVHKVCIL